jgi:hypothetical protein
MEQSYRERWDPAMVYDCSRLLQEECEIAYQGKETLSA